MNLLSAWSASLLFGTVCVLVALIGPSGAYVTSFPSEPDIDGALLTVGIVVAEFLAGMIPYPGVSALVLAIIEAWTPKPEDDYWEQVEEQVEQVCGEYINQENLEQILVYKNDLMSLMTKYNTAPIQSDGSYPDKNTLADSITTSIISQRYLLEGSEMPWSMSLHFVDIASVHILILKDVADIYSTEKEVSLWWSDLARELSHYSAYSRDLYTETLQWRRDNVECYVDTASQACLDFQWAGTVCYDRIEVRDHVANTVDKCTQVHTDSGQGPCDRECGLYEHAMTRDVSKWYRDHVQKAVDQWETLRLRAEMMAEQASQYYNPAKKV